MCGSKGSVKPHLGTEGRRNKALSAFVPHLLLADVNGPCDRQGCGEP